MCTPNYVDVPVLLDIADSVSMSSDDDGARGKKKSNRGEGREEEDMEVGEDATTLQQKGGNISYRLLHVS